jgi:hypothetical protein
MTHIPLCVPRWDESAAFRAGAQYDASVGFYITSADFEENFYDWLPAKWRDPAPVLLPDMLPSTTWEDNVRTAVSSERWDKLRRYSYAAAGHRCEICGSKGDPHLECHEKWGFNDATRIQKLIKFLSLCPKCHKAHHIGYARSAGMLPVVLAHIQAINGWDAAQMATALANAEALWRKRSAHTWTVDLSWLDTGGYSKV